MRTFAQQSSFMRCLSQFFVRSFRLPHQYKRNVLSGVFLTVATLIAIVELVESSFRSSPTEPFRESWWRV